MANSTQQLRLLHESSNSRIYYKADSAYGQPVIIKVLNSEHPTPQQIICYNNEYEFTKDLKVDGIRKSLAQIRLDDKPALVMEYFVGQTLTEAFAIRAQSLVEFLQAAIHITKILGELHQHNIIHGDINSQNILINRETGQVRLIDFSIATRLDVQIQHTGNPERLAGTLAYISPEQTGRMNRAVDYRTDLYSLGVTFYELLTGHVPFETDDPLALVHAHLAKVPQAVSVLSPDVPPILSDIVMKLLAKNAEDRYQSAFGLRADLERCLNHLRDPEGSTGAMELRFDLGQDDYSGQFRLQQKLYGRSTEIAALLDAFKRAAAGTPELVLVAGYPGVGKSALVAEVHQPITEKRGYFISGKFEQYQQNTPYAAFSQALNQLADYLLTERESTLQEWRNQIIAAVRGNGAVLTEVIPHLEKVIGPQPAVPKLDGEENRNRFHLTFQDFVRAISTAEHPLVVFIDDWQWADLASQELLKLLLRQALHTHLLIIGAYRDKEVGRTHPFTTTLHELAAAGAALQTIQLGNLEPEDVRQLIQESLACSDADSHALTELVYEKTQGNAFFARQFLQNLYEEGWLHFDFDAHHWEWDMAQLKAQNITDNVVELMTTKLKRLSRQTTDLLRLAACIGSTFDLQTLALISQTSEAIVLTGLTEALTQGFVIPQDDYYKLPAAAGQARFTFLHDRVRQAAYAQIPAAKRQSVHLVIGRLLLANTPEAMLGQRVFEIVQHYHQAGPLVTNEMERLHLVELNMQAAELANRAAAFGSAQVYLEDALALMPADAWSGHYDAMLKLHSQLAFVFALTGDFEQLERVFQITETHAHTMADTVRVRLAKIHGLVSHGRFPEAIESGLSLIEALGVPIDRNPVPEEAFAYLQETAEWLTPARIDSLLYLPEASTEVGAIMEAAVAINGPVFGSNMNLCFVFVSRIARLCVERGMSPLAPVTLSAFALLLSSALHDISKARLLIDMTMQLNRERYPVESLVAYLSVSYGGFIMHRYAHLKDTLPVLANGIQKGLMTGAFLFDGYLNWWHAWHHLFLGTPLARVEAVCQQAVETCQRIQMERFRDWCSLVHQATLNLQRKSDSPVILKGESYDEQEMLAVALQINDFAEVFRILFYRAWLHYLFGRHQAAVKLFQEAEAYLMYGAGLYIVPLFYFYDALANAAVYGEHGAEEQAQILERIHQNLEQMEVWVRFAPMNHQHKKDLMEAERARIEGRYWEATTYYEQAIQGARENEYLNEEALACERAGEFYLSHGLEKMAQYYMTRAHEGYSSWQAWAKVQELEQRHQKWLAIPAQFASKESTTEQGEILRSLDLMSVMKASQAISRQIILDELLRKLMDIVIENAGAQQGCLILEKDERWVIEAQGTADLKGRVTLQAVEVEDSDTVCASIVRYAARSQETIVLDHAAREGLFVDDAYVKRNQTKSVLCMPLLNQGRLIGILYLENNLAANTFTPQRIEVLKLLAGQAAIALENARLYQQAQQEIAERKLAETAMRESEGAYRAFVENLPIGVYRISPDPNGSHLIANPAFLRMVGYESLEELVQKSTVADLYQDPTESRNFSDNLLAKGHVDRVEVYLKRSDGTPMWGAITASVGHSSSGDVYFDCIIEDITERKRTEAQIERALRETQTRFEISQALVGAETEEEVLDVLIQHASLYPQAFVAIFTFDRTGGELVATLRRQDTFESGFAAAMSIGEHLPASRYTLFNHFFADQPFVSENVEADERFEPAGRAALEQMGAVSFAALPLTVGNEWMGYIGVMAKPRGYFDEEKRHLYQTLAEQGSVALHAARLREMVRASQQRLALLVQQSPLAVMEWDIDHRVVSWNPAAERIFGYNAKEALGFHMMDLIVPPAARPLFDQTWQALLTQEDGGNTIHDNITKAGCTITCEWFNAPLINADGQAIGIASLVQDITERKQAETERETLITSLEAQNAELERFTYTVSHDLKAPLITIRGFLGYIEQDAVSGDIHRLKGDLQRISAATDKMQRLLNELLELSRIGRLMNPAQNIGFADLIQDAIKLLERQLREKHVEVRVQDDLPIVWGDPQRLLEVVQNLVDNAIKFMGGQTKPVIEIGTQGEEKGMPVLYVRDNGMGIAPQHHDRIFGLFNKLDANAEGTGVGLTIVKRIIEIHGGRIWVESEEGRGATFYFTLGKEIQSP